MPDAGDFERDHPQPHADFGWGEAFAQGLEPPEIAATVIDKALRPLIVGADPLDIEVLWHRMYHMTRDYGRKGSVVAELSDLASRGRLPEISSYSMPPSEYTSLRLSTSIPGCACSGLM